MSENSPADDGGRSAAPTTRPASSEERHRSRVEVERDEAFSEFFRATISPLVAFLVNQGATVPVAADIAQETMIKAYQRWSEVHTPRAWVYRVASRELVRTIAAVEEVPVGRVPEPSSLLPRPDAIADWEARHDALPVLRSLPPRQRQVMAWTLAGFTPGDIAERLSLDVQTVRANLRKARRAAAAYLKAREEER